MTLVPSLSRNQWLWLGGAAVLGVTEVLSAPIAVALAVLPVLDNIAKDQGSSGRRSSSASDSSPRSAASPTRQRAAARPSATPRRTSTRAGARRGRASGARGSRT